jgi:hypothetical protein
LSHSTSPFLWRIFFKIGSHYLPKLVSNHNLPNLCLLSSWDHRREPPAPG